MTYHVDCCVRISQNAGTKNKHATFIGVNFNIQIIVSVHPL